MSATKHTKGPYHVEFTKTEIIIASPDGYIATVYDSEIGENGQDTAAFIVRACNAHDELVAALEACLAPLQQEQNRAEHTGQATAASKAFLMARAALAKAKPQ